MARRTRPRRNIARIRAACAGWSIASAHRPLFGEGDSMLARYATRFDAVEINSSFYRPHRRDTYARWAATVPDGFRFSVKLPRTITHDAHLRGSGPLLDAFFGQTDGLGPKLGCVLVQLPPSLAFDGRVAATFFAMLRRRWDGPVACEPRHPSWFMAKVDPLWARHRIARAAADPARVPEAAIAAGSGPVRYWRWHGAPRMYYSAYGEAALNALAAEVARATPAGTDAWVVFDNTAHGHATTDALTFQALAHRN